MMRKIFANKEVVTDVTSLDISSEVATDDKTHTRLGWWVVLAGVGGFILWASVAPLDQGVPISGTVVVATNRKAVQHQSGGTVEDILVKEGDVVKAGQALVRMNDIQVRAQAEITRGQYFSARATEARLIAERDGKNVIALSPELTKEPAKSDPHVAEMVALQKQLFASRRSSLENELAGLDVSISGLKMQAHGLEESLDSKKQQLKFLKEELDGVRDLAKDGFVARNRLLELERTTAQTSGMISEDIGNIGRASRQVAELNLRRIQRQQDYQKEVRTQLSEVQKEAEALQNRLLAQDFDLENAVVKAPVAGTVMGINVFTRGGVIGPGYRMMDIVPSEDALIVSGRVPVNLIDKVHQDLEVELIFSAFNQNKTPHIPGVITRVSVDRLIDEHTGAPYYEMSAKVAPSGAKMVEKLPIRAGMPVEIFVKTGSRTMMSYLFKPVFDRAKTSMSEE